MVMVLKVSLLLLVNRKLLFRLKANQLNHRTLLGKLLQLAMPSVLSFF